MHYTSNFPRNFRLVLIWILDEIPAKTDNISVFHIFEHHWFKSTVSSTVIVRTVLVDKAALIHSSMFFVHPYCTKWLTVFSSCSMKD